MKEEETTKTLFEKWSKGLFAASGERFHPLFQKWWIKELNLPENSKVLDVGCGSGWASRMIAKMVPNGEVIGVDFADGMIKNAKMKIFQDDSHDYDNLRFEVAGVEDIPCPDDYFDYAICIVSFSWYSDPKIAIKEMKRVLKPGGKLYVAEAPDSPLTRLMCKVWKLFSSSIDKWNLYSENKFKDFFDAEFTDVYQKKKGGVLLTIGTKK